ncbi:MAG: glycosyltransferase family 2 protein [Verrucomicrobia bacterium]|nr:glycosyltransferase family 2 protein [Verrucomicrobiota bacterium]
MSDSLRSDRSLSVVIPVHNEADTIRGILDDVYEKCLNHLSDYELIIVEDGSSDDTKDVLRECSNIYPNMVLSLDESKLGYGAAASKGLKMATKEWVLLMDGDGQIEAADMSVLLTSSTENDLVLAEKFPRCDPVFRIILSRIFDVLTDLVLGVSIRDINFGFRVMRNSILQDIVARCGKLGDIYNAEVAIRFVYAGHKVDQVRVRHRKREIGKSHGVPAGKVLGTSWKAYRGLFALKKELTSRG